MEPTDTTGWAVLINSDLTEGRGFEMVRHVCKLEMTAKRLAHGINVQGSDGQILPVRLYRQDGRLYGPVHLEMPTIADERDQERLDEWREVLAKAEQLGLSQDEIAVLQAGRG